MNNSPIVYQSTFKYKHEIELIEAVLSIYAISVLKTTLPPREKTVLREYIISDYNAETKKGLCITLGISAVNLTSINYSLKQKGFLINHPTNQRLKLLNTELKKLRDTFIKSPQRKMFLVEFKANV